MTSDEFAPGSLAEVPRETNVHSVDTRSRAGQSVVPKSGRRRSTAGRLTRNIVPGVHKLEHAYVNCYLLEGRGGVTIVDAAFPGTWPLILSALLAIGRRPADVAAIVLTHAHFDHLGFAARAAREWGVPVFVHRLDQFIAAHPYRYTHERARALYPLKHPRSVPILAAMTAVGALRVEGMSSLAFFEPGDTLDLPGQPQVLFTPGHTFGHSSLHLPDASTIITGDALVTMDPYTGHRGPQIVAGAATADSSQALDSLNTLAETNARIVLPGHGEPWKFGIRRAVEKALQRGPS